MSVVPKSGTSSIGSAETLTARGPFRIDVVDDMTIEWDVPIETGDGVILRADVFRPTAPGAYPSILSSGPYGKGLWRRREGRAKSPYWAIDLRG